LRPHGPICLTLYGIAARAARMAAKLGRPGSSTARKQAFTTEQAETTPHRRGPDGHGLAWLSSAGAFAPVCRCGVRLGPPRTGAWASASAVRCAVRRSAEDGLYRCMGFCQCCAVRRPAEDSLYRSLGFCQRWALRRPAEGGPYRCMGFCQRCALRRPAEDGLYRCMGFGQCGMLWRPAAGTTHGARASACTEHGDPRPRKRRTGAWTFSDCGAYGLPVVAGVQPASSVASGAACGAVALCGLEQSRKLSRAGLDHSSYASAAPVS
jgi:hypothetical protein